MLLGAGLSGAVLFTPLWPAVKHQAARAAVVIMIIIVVMHLVLAVGFMLYFFHIPSSAPAGGHNVTAEVTVPAHDNLNNASNISEDHDTKQKVEVNVQEDKSRNESSSEAKRDLNSDTNDKGDAMESEAVKDEKTGPEVNIASESEIEQKKDNQTQNEADQSQNVKVQDDSQN